MGVPVLTMKGYNFNSRCGESINKNLNLKDLIAVDYEDYINKAINFTKDKNLLEKINGKHYEKFLNSHLFDTSKFTINFEKKLEEIFIQFYK